MAGQLYYAIIKSIRDIDESEGGGFLKRFLGRKEEWLDKQSLVIEQDLANVWNPDKCPDLLIQHHLAFVGFGTRHRALTEGRSKKMLRKLVLAGIPMWMELLSPQGLINMVRLFTGKIAIYDDHFKLRATIGQSVIGDAGSDPLRIVGGEDTYEDECMSLLKLQDDGLLDEDLLLGLVNLQRPTNETIEVVLFDFIDRFSTEESLVKWENLGAEDPTFDLTTKTMRLVTASPVAPIIPILSQPTSVLHGLLEFKAKAGADSDIIIPSVLTQADDERYDVEFDLGGGTPVVRLIRYDVGAPTTIATSPIAIPFVEGVWYTFRVMFLRTGTTNKIVAHLDGNSVLSHDDVGIADPAYGTFSLAVDSAGADFDDVTFSRLPGRYAKVMPNEVTQMTDNFIQ